MLESGVYPKSWEAISPDAQAISDEYVHVSEILESLGYEHYEVSNVDIIRTTGLIMVTVVMVSLLQVL